MGADQYRANRPGAGTAKYSRRGSARALWKARKERNRILEPEMPDQAKISFRRKVIYVGIISLGIPALLVMSSELVGRAYIHFQYGIPGKSYGLWRYDSELGTVHNENAYNTTSETNDYGFRNKENVFEPKPKGSHRVIAYGGSTTYSYNLLNDEAWPIQLQNLLRRQHDSRDQVLNGGAFAWSLSHAYARARGELPLLRPDYVILYSGINEETNANALRGQGKELQSVLDQGAFGAFATKLGRNGWLTRNSVIVRILDYYIRPILDRWLDRWSVANGKNGGEAGSVSKEIDQVVLEHYLLTLRAFLDLIKQVGARPVFVIQAHGYNNAVTKRLTQYSRLAAPVARDAGAITIDAQEVVDSYSGNPMDLFYSSGVHWSSVGAIRLAKFIQENAF